VRQKCDEFMSRVNALAGSTREQDVLITAFWEQEFLPHCERNKRTATVRGYKKIWSQHLGPHFAGQTLREYQTHQGVRFLTGLAERVSAGILSPTFAAWLPGCSAMPCN